MFSCPQQGYTGRPGPGFHEARKGAGLAETVVGTGGHRQDRDAVLSPKDSLVAFSLAPCPGSVLWPLSFRTLWSLCWLSSQVDQSASQGCRHMAAVWTDFSSSLGHDSAMVTWATALHSGQRDRGLCYDLCLTYNSYILEIANVWKGS